IGRHILNYFGKDFKIVGFDTVQGPEMEHVEWVIGDILDVDRLTQAARGCDAMIHLAGIPIYNPDRDLDSGRVNIYGMQCAVEAAARAARGSSALLTRAASAPRRLSFGRSAGPPSTSRSMRSTSTCPTTSTGSASFSTSGSPGRTSAATASRR